MVKGGRARTDYPPDGRYPFTIYEYFKADGSQGADFYTAATTTDPTYVTCDTTAPTDGNWPTDVCEYSDDFGQSWGYDPTGVDEANLPAGFEARRASENPNWRGTSYTFPAWIDPSHGEAGDPKHRLYNLSWIGIRFWQEPYGQNFDARMWQREPNVEVLMRGRKFLLPGQTEPIWTDNAAAVRYWWETERRGRSPEAIDMDAYNHAFDLCEEEVIMTLPEDAVGYSNYDLTHKRYTVNGVIDSGQDVSAVEDQLDAAWAGEVIEVGGKLYFTPGEDTEPVLHITDDDVINTSAPSAQPVPPLQARINTSDCQILQSSHPDHEYGSLDLPRFRDTFAIERDGEERVRAFRLAYVQDPLAAARMQAVIVRQARESLRIGLTVLPGNVGLSESDTEIDNFRHMALRPRQTILLTNSDFGQEAQPFLIDRVVVNPDWTVDLSLREDLPGTYEDTLILPAIDKRKIVFDDFVPEVTGLITDEIAETGNDGSVTIYLNMEWQPQAVQKTVIEINLGNQRLQYETSYDEFRFPLAGARRGDTITGRIWHVGHNGTAGERLSWSETIDGDIIPPGNITNTVIKAIWGGYRLTWTNPTDSDFKEAVILQGTDSSLAKATEAYRGRSEIYDGKGVAGQQLYVWIRAVDSSENLGAAVRMTVTPLAVPTVNLFTAYIKGLYIDNSPQREYGHSWDCEMSWTAPTRHKNPLLPEEYTVEIDFGGRERDRDGVLVPGTTFQWGRKLISAFRNFNETTEVGTASTWREDRLVIGIDDQSKVRARYASSLGRGPWTEFAIGQTPYDPNEPPIVSFVGPPVGAASQVIDLVAWVGAAFSGTTATITNNDGTPATNINLLPTNGPDTIYKTNAVTMPSHTDGNWILTVENGNGAVTRNIKVASLQGSTGVATASISLSPYRIRNNNSATLTWNSTGGQSWRIDVVTEPTGLMRSIGTVTKSGRRVIRFTREGIYTFRLTVTSRGGTTTESARVIVSNTNSRPVKNSFSIYPSSGESGRSVRVRWDITGATAISISNVGTNLPNSGSRTVNPTEDTRFMLSARNAFGTLQDSIIYTIVDDDDDPDPTPKPPAPPTPPADPDCPPTFWGGKAYINPWCQRDRD